MQAHKNQHVYLNNMDMQKRTALPLFAIIFFGSIVLYSVLATLMIHMKSWLSYGIGIAGVILLANLTLFLAAVAYHYFVKDESY